MLLYVKYVLTVDSSNGQLKEYLTAGISKSDFLHRVKLALNDGRETSTPVTTESNSTPAVAPRAIKRELQRVPETMCPPRRNSPMQ